VKRCGAPGRRRSPRKKGALHEAKKIKVEDFRGAGAGTRQDFWQMSSLLEVRELRKSYSRATALLSGNGHGPRFTAVDGAGGPSLRVLQGWGFCANAPSLF